MHGIVARMRQLIDEYPERLLIAEIYLPVHRLVAYYGTSIPEAHLPFNFMLITLPWDARQIAAAIDEYEGALPADAWPNWVMGNHDQPRITSRVGPGQAKIAAMLLLTLRGTPTLYYGDEIGMRDVPIPAEEVRDPQGLNMPGKNLSRDPERTPMQWNGSENAGFTSGKPWLRLDRAFHRRNVTVQQEDIYSSLVLYQRLIRLRQELSLAGSTYRSRLFRSAADCLYPAGGRTPRLPHRSQPDTPTPRYFSRRPRSAFAGSSSSILSRRENRAGSEDKIDLSGDEGVIVRLEEWQPASAKSDHALSYSP